MFKIINVFLRDNETNDLTKIQFNKQSVKFDFKIITSTIDSFYNYNQATNFDFDIIFEIQNSNDGFIPSFFNSEEHKNLANYYHVFEKTGKAFVTKTSKGIYCLVEDQNQILTKEEIRNESISSPLIYQDIVSKLDFINFINLNDLDKLLKAKEFINSNNIIFINDRDDNLISQLNNVIDNYDEIKNASFVYEYDFNHPIINKINENEKYIKDVLVHPKFIDELINNNKNIPNASEMNFEILNKFKGPNLSNISIKEIIPHSIYIGYEINWIKNKSIYTMFDVFVWENATEILNEDISIFFEKIFVLSKNPIFKSFSDNISLNFKEDKLKNLETKIYELKIQLENKNFEIMNLEKKHNDEVSALVNENKKLKSEIYEFKNTFKDLDIDEEEMMLEILSQKNDSKKIETFFNSIGKDIVKIFSKRK